jgi:transcriptional regulator with XRE-family HTH domain
MTIGERIKTRRNELKLSQRKLGGKCNVTGASVSLWESGETEPSGETLLLLADALDRSPEWIMNGDSKQSIAADDQRFVDFVKENIHHLDDERRSDIKKLIDLAKERANILARNK